MASNSKYGELALQFLMPMSDVTQLSDEWIIDYVGTMHGVYYAT